MNITEIANVLHTTVYGESVNIKSIISDSRQVGLGDLFVALIGEYSNGHDYINEAKKSGAAAVIVSQDYYNQHEIDGLSVIAVKDTLIAYGVLSKWYRSLFDPVTVAITGSCGKTTTRALIENIFRQKAKVLASKKSYNNNFGVPLTIFQCDDSYDYYVQELGANHPGEIATLSVMVQPDIAVITNIAPVHMEGFGSIDNVIQTKLGITKGLADSGSVVLNADSEYISKLRGGVGHYSVVTFGIDNQADVMAEQITSNTLGSQFQLKTSQGNCQILLPLLGRHNVMNSLAAAAAAITAGLSLDHIKLGLDTMEPVSRRMVIYKGFNGCSVVDDSYNSNPKAMMIALDALQSWHMPYYLVMGSMKELGDVSESWHRKIANYAKQANIKGLYCYGEEILYCCT